MRPKIMSDSKLLELATEVILQHGPEAFTLRKIAEYAKVSPATLIKRFESKDKLLMMCISQHISKFSANTLSENTNLESFIHLHAKNHKKDNIIQNISLLARDMREPVLNKLTGKYFDSFKSALLIIIKNDKRFNEVIDKKEFVLQIEAIFQGSIIQGAFLKNKSIKKNVEERLSEYIHLKCNIHLNWT